MNGTPTGPTTASTITSATDSILRSAYHTGTTIHVAPAFSNPSSLPTLSTQSKENDQVGEEVDALGERMTPCHASTYPTPKNDVRANVLPQMPTSLVSFKSIYYAPTHPKTHPENKLHDNAAEDAGANAQEQRSADVATEPSGLPVPLPVDTHLWVPSAGREDVWARVVGGVRAAGGARGGGATVAMRCRAGRSGGGVGVGVAKMGAEMR
ncbi:hypothetical protein B0A49_06550 [Cryomyces minteri]|uniref:Uncharacterized protein n=1 Tax=Cryomyces minteri TaxID=331657 RepID=A0A4U0WQ55_9PEZI|nr:hypothetical protein B0A49_06550 [Cryomyces minteri]